MQMRNLKPKDMNRSDKNDLKISLQIAVADKHDLQYLLLKAQKFAKTCAAV